MAYLGTWQIDDYLPIPATTHRFSTGAAYAPSAITYSIYEDATTTGLDEDVDMVPASPFGSVVGLYYARRQLTAAAGFEVGKNYLVVIKATVDSVAAITTHTFQIAAAVPTAIQNADALLVRDWTSVSGEAARSALNALRFLRNKWSIAGTTLTVTEEDDATSAWTATLSSTAEANPVTGSDPA
ncbi:MAG TPA: hypothetical protein VM537_07490 [Anaerolineae bacterium]|nr:hypothetical protein [Anaerolineae bacterium]